MADGGSGTLRAPPITRVLLSASPTTGLIGPSPVVGSLATRLSRLAPPELAFAGTDAVIGCPTRRATIDGAGKREGLSTAFGGAIAVADGGLLGPLPPDPVDKADLVRILSSTDEALRDVVMGGHAGGPRRTGM
jgi:hypothetical protein